jgi:flagellar assembly protein FliH
MSTHRTFSFGTEFTPDGAVLSGPGQSYFSRDEADRLAAVARAEGEAKAKATGFAGVDRIVGHLTPAQAQIAAIAEGLRREAAELAMIAARKIAGDALDANGAKIAAEAVEQAVRLLKHSPALVVSAAPDTLASIEMRMEHLRRQRTLPISFIADPKAKPGDWRVEWTEGAASFSREEVERQIDAVMKARLTDPVEPQLELFNVA